MKLVATDFDGTFCSYGGGVPEANLAAVKKWQEAGHKFGINTGRGISLIDMEIEKYEGLVPDFLICNNGAVVTDAERSILASLRFPQALTKGLLQLLREKRGDAPMLVVTERESLAIGGNLSDAALGLPDMPSTTLEKAIWRDDIVQVSLNCGTQENALATEAMVRASFPQGDGLAGGPGRSLRHRRRPQRPAGHRSLSRLHGRDGAGLHEDGGKKSV